jgi:tetratricopeptide (TPR) repeat protein
MWRTSLLIVLTLAMALSNVQPCFARELIKSLQVESAVYQLVSQAESMIAAKNFVGARDLLLRAARQDPTSYSKNVHRDLMQVYLSLNQFEGAVAEGKKVLLIDPSDDYAPYVVRHAGSYGFMTKGQEALAAQKYSEAKNWFRRAAEYDPSPYTAFIHSNLCYALQKLGESNAAIEEGKRALAADPSDANAAYTIALAYGDQAMFDDALLWMRRYASMERDPGRRQQALETATTLENDKKQFLDPNNKKPDYVDVMHGSADDIVRWPQNKLPVKVAIASGAGVRGHKPEFNNLVKLALDNWCQASGKKLDYKLVKNAEDADILVRWTKDPLDFSLEHPNMQPCGLTHLNDDGSKNATTALVEVRTVNPFHPERPVSDSECAHVVLHEIGHALGVGHSKLIKDVMYFRAAPQQRALSSRDKATVARLYQDYPVIGFVPKHEDTPAAATAPVAPPAFLPPALPDDSKVSPPMFLPPAVPENEKLTPPMFVPPSAEQSHKNDVPVPMFLPPAVKTAPPPPKSAPSKTAPKPPNAQKINVPFFVPPAAK